MSEIMRMQFPDEKRMTAANRNIQTAKARGSSFKNALDKAFDAGISERSSRPLKTEKKSVADQTETGTKELSKSVDKALAAQGVKLDEKVDTELEANAEIDETKNQELAATQMQGQTVTVKETVIPTESLINQLFGVADGNVMKDMLQLVNETEKINISDMVSVPDSEKSLNPNLPGALQKISANNAENVQNKDTGIRLEGDFVEVTSEIPENVPQITKAEKNLTENGQSSENSNQETDENFLNGNVLIRGKAPDPDKFNIKVAEAPVNTANAEAAKEMADKIMYKMIQGKHEFDMELNPASLGKVNIKMIFGDGNAEIVMTTSSHKAHQFLSSQIDALRAILENAAGTGNIVVKESEQSEGKNDRNDLLNENGNKQGQQQEQRKREENNDPSFVDKLRLGLAEGLREAV